MKITDLFVKRPVLADRRQPGDPDRRAAVDPLAGVRQYPRSDIAVIRVSTAYVGANADLVRGFITTPLERVIASADGIDYLESSSAQGISTITVHLKLNYDTNAALTQIQAKVAQVRNDLPPEAEAPDHRAGDGGQPVRGHVHRLRLGRARPEPDHRLPDARRAAEAVGHQRRAARRHPGRPHVRHARLAEARQDGRARHLALASVREALASNNYLSALGRTKGSMVSVNLIANTDLKHRRRVPAAGRQGEGRRGRPPGRDRGRRARRRELRRGRALRRPDRDLHGRLGAAHRELARRDPRGARGHARHRGRSCRRA